MATSKPKYRLDSNFKAAKGASHDAIQAARDEALATGIDESRKRLGKARQVRGYDLDPFVVEQDKTELGGRIYIGTDKWYYKFFEHGTVYIPAVPFMRPAHRKMRATFKAELGEHFEKYVSRRAGIHK